MIYNKNVNFIFRTMVNRRKVTVFVRRFWSCLFLLCAISVYAHGQVMKNVSGVIKDAAGEPVIGVNVVLRVTLQLVLYLI